MNIRNTIITVLKFVFPLLCVVILLELIVHLGLLNAEIFPPPSQVTFTLFELATRKPPYPSLLDHILTSAYRILLGYALGVVSGVSLGILMGINRIAYRAFSPIISLLISVPTLAWVPLLLIFVFGDTSVILAISLGSFFAVVYNTMNGIRSVNKQFIWASQIMGADRTTVFFNVLLPGSMVSMVTGLRLAIGYSWRALVGAEMLAAVSQGAGYLIFVSRWGHNADVVFAGLVVIAVGGLLMDRVIMRPIEKKTIEKWGMVREA